MTSTCLCLLTRDGGRQVLLGHKKTGLGTGKIVGLGGHVEDCESPAEAAAREVKEEAGIHVTPAALLEVAHVTFLFPVCPRWDMIAFVFTSAEWLAPAPYPALLKPRGWRPAILSRTAGGCCVRRGQERVCKDLL